MSEMIERVAKALYDNMCLANPHVMTTWEALTWDLKSYYSEQARAAIRAMEEPTSDMDWAGHCTQMDEKNAGMVWRSMIDAALASAGRIEGG